MIPDLFTKLSPGRGSDSGDAQFAPLFAEIGAGNFNPFIGQCAPPRASPAYIPPIRLRVLRVPVLNPDGIPTATRAYDNTRCGAARAPTPGTRSSSERDYLYDSGSTCISSRTGGMGASIWPLGYEHREVNSKQIPDSVQAASDQLGFDPVASFQVSGRKSTPGSSS